MHSNWSRDFTTLRNREDNSSKLFLASFAFFFFFFFNRVILFSILFFRDVNFVIRVEYHMCFIIFKAFHNQNFSRLSKFLAMPVKFN